MPRNIIIFCLMALIFGACEEVPVKPEPVSYPTQKPVVQQKPEPAVNKNLQPILRLDTGGHTSMIRKFAVTSDKKYLISCSDDKTIRVWDIQTNEENSHKDMILKKAGYIEIRAVEDDVMPKDFKPIKIRIVESDLRVVQNYQEVRKILGEIGDGSLGKILTIALSPDNQYLAVGGVLFHGSGIDKVGNIRIYCFPTGELSRVLKSHSNVVCDLSFSPDNRYLVSGGDYSIKIWDIRNDFSLIHTFGEHRNQVYAVRIFPYKSDYRIVSAADDNQVILYSLNQKKKLASFSHQGGADSLAVSKKHIASAGWDNKINIFDHSLKHIRTINSENTPIGLAFSPDGKLLLAGTATIPRNCNIYDTEHNSPYAVEKNLITV